MRNIYSDIPAIMKEELTEVILQSPHFRIERIISHGQCSPEGFWYDQDDNEWVVLLRGHAVLRFDNQSEPVLLNPGDFIHIDKHVRHRVESTDPDQDTVWLAVFY